MLNKRKWDILEFAASGRQIEELYPPLDGTELRFYQDHKAQHEEVRKKLPPGVTFQFVPPNDIDYDESAEPWPPVYSGE